MGALTSKVYAFQYRSWELQSDNVVMLNTTFGNTVTLQKRADRIIRILPSVNTALNSDLISDQTRFSFDSEMRNRLKKKLKKNYVKYEKKLYTIYKPIVKKNFLSFLRDIFQSKGVIHTIIGKYIDMETILAFKESNNLLSNTKETYLFPAESITSNADFRSSYFSSININALEVCDSLLLIGCNPVVEEPLLAVKIRKAVLDRNIPVYTLGNLSTTMLETINLGSSINRLINICLGKDKFCLNLLKVKNPLIIVGTEFFERKDADYLMKLLKTLYQNISLLTYTKNKLYEHSSNNQITNSNLAWNGLIYLYRHVGTLNSLELGANLGKYFHTKQPYFLLNFKNKVNRLLYLVGADNIKVTKNLYNFVIYQGSHGGQGSIQADLVLPTVTPLSRSAIYSSIFGHYNLTKKVVQKLLWIKSPMYYPVYFSLLLTNKQTFGEFSEFQIKNFFKFRFKSFRYALLNRFIGITANTTYLLSPFQFSAKLASLNQLSENFLMKNLFYLLLSELENSDLFEGIAQKTLMGTKYKLPFLKRFRRQFHMINMKQKQESRKLLDIYVNTNNQGELKISNTLLRLPMINYFLTDNTMRSSMFLTLAWLRTTSRKNNFIN